VLPKNHQPVTTWANQDEAFREIAEGIRAVAMEVKKIKKISIFRCDSKTIASVTNCKVGP
jgi:hypothetical protein